LKTITHIAIRLSDQTYNLPSTVIRHNLVSCRQGATWLGKPDRALTRRLVQNLNEQIEAGYPTYLFIIDPDRRNPARYRAELQRVSLKSPPDKELVPGFYKELKIVSRIKTWFKIGNLDGFRLDEMPGLEQANAEYAQMEELASWLGITSVPGYFELSQETSESVLRPGDHHR
jgi:hypothetical protein